MWGGQDTIVRHGQDGDLGDGAVAAFDSSGAFVDCRQICVHVSWVSATTGNFLSCGGDFTESVTVCGQVGQNDQDMLFELVGVVFGCGQSETGRDNTFDAVLFLVRGNVTWAITHVGSLAKLRNSVTLSILPFSSKSRVKNRLVSMLTPMAAKTMEKLSSCPSCTPLVGFATRPA